MEIVHPEEKNWEERTNVDSWQRKEKKWGRWKEFDEKSKDKKLIWKGTRKKQKQIINHLRSAHFGKYEWMNIMTKKHLKFTRKEKKDNSGEILNVINKNNENVKRKKTMKA